MTGAADRGPAGTAAVQAEARVIHFGDGELAYHQAGRRGPAVVLLSGAGLDDGLLSWRYTIPALAVDHRVFAPDWPRQGGSRPWREPAGGARLRVLVLDLFESWGLGRVTLVGLSQGGAVAADVALSYPERVERLVLVDPAGMVDRYPPGLQQVLFLATRLPALTRSVLAPLVRSRSVVEWYVRRILCAGTGPDPADLADLLDAIRVRLLDRGVCPSDWERESIGWWRMRTNHVPRLPAIGCPTLVVHGRQDRVVPLRAGRAAAAAIPGAGLHVVEDCGHWPPRERPVEFNAVLRRFLADPAV